MPSGMPSRSTSFTSVLKITAPVATQSYGLRFGMVDVDRRRFAKAASDRSDQASRWNVCDDSKVGAAQDRSEALEVPGNEALPPTCVPLTKTRSESIWLAAAANYGGLEILRRRTTGKFPGSSATDRACKLGDDEVWRLRGCPCRVVVHDDFLNGSVGSRTMTTRAAPALCGTILPDRCSGSVTVCGSQD